MHSKEINEVLELVNSSKSGLSEEEALKRLQKDGFNELPKGKKETIFHMFLSQLKNPIIYILMISTVLSFMIGEVIDASFIIAIILLDAILGTYQEYRAVRSSEALEELIKNQSLVLRNGKEMMIDSKNLVVGDIVILGSGDKINADLRIIEANNLEINEAVLTGESLPSLKHNQVLNQETILNDRENMGYAGTSVVKGRAVGVVVATRTNTEIGKIANTILFKENEKSPLMQRMEKFTTQISYFVVIISLIIVVILYFKGYAPKEIFFSVVALAVSAIPEGLPVSLTLVLSIASNRMSKKNVIVKKLNSVESLGSCTIIASDKTGTLTLNEQTAKKIWLKDNTFYDITGAGYNDDGEVLNANDSVKELALMGLINNEAKLYKDNIWKYIGDSIDVAFLSLAYKLKLKSNYKILSKIPYESENKYSAVFYQKSDEIECTVKGSLEKVLTFCNEDAELILKQNDNFAKDGYRVIALAKGKVKGTNETDIKNLDFLGLVAFIDPIRKDAISSIDACKKAGIKVLMITGDHPLTAFSIGKELKIVNDENEVVSSTQLEQVFNQGLEQFDQFIKNKKIFSRVTPIQKLEIVESFKRQGEFIAVTGDGVNDAPALKSANIGIAMGSGTEVAKEASTMIITDDRFSSIVNGIEEGRLAYNNVRKVSYLLLSTGVGEVILFILAILFNLPLPLIAVQLLWLNLVTNGLQDVALSFEKKDVNVLNMKPRSPRENIFNKSLMTQTLIIGSFVGIIIFLLFGYLIRSGTDIKLARGFVILLMVFMQNLHTLSCRSEYVSIFKLPLKNNYLVVIVVVCTFLLQILVSQNSSLSNILGVTTIKGVHVIIMILLALPIILISELIKIVRRRELI